MAANLVIIEDKTIVMMLGDPRFTAKFPCLSTAQAALVNVPKQCGRCNQKRAKARSGIMNEVRQCIATMPKSGQLELKALLGAKKLRLNKRDSSGRTIQLTF